MFKLLVRVFVGVLAGIGVLTVAAVIWLVSGGMSSRRNPGAVETWVAVRMRSVAMPAAARKMADPEPAGPLALKIGLEQFADHCAMCHGNDGSGQADMGRGLYPRPPDLRGEATQSMTDGEIFHVINNGVRFTGMPAWNHAGRESWALVHFIRRLPELSKAESDRMKTLNPKAAGEAVQPPRRSK
jgi:mono/diheme cytochrome c family protein